MDIDHVLHLQCISAQFKVNVHGLHIQLNHNLQGSRVLRLHVETSIAKGGTIIIVRSSLPWQIQFKVRQLHCNPLSMVTGQGRHTTTLSSGSAMHTKVLCLLY